MQQGPMSTKEENNTALQGRRRSMHNKQEGRL